MEIPPELLRLRLDFLAAQARCEELSAAMPTNAQLREGYEISREDLDERNRALGEARKARLVLAVELSGHPWFGEQKDAVSAREAVEKAAKAALAGSGLEPAAA
ncbi:hypothetical protein [Actinocorallia herbida]|uniref:hypothetical protein n=1 Tax=Actinocorallia herbida TaxID=58109 RepID=UPI000F4B1C0D|nr:hypothetical protein [Actinocorallia herbida]